MLRINRAVQASMTTHSRSRKTIFVADKADDLFNVSAKSRANLYSFSSRKGQSQALLAFCVLARASFTKWNSLTRLAMILIPRQISRDKRNGCG